MPSADARRGAQCWAVAQKHPAASNRVGLHCLGSPVDEVQVDAVVQAFSQEFQQGLAVLHDPANVVVWYRPGLKPEAISCPDAAQLLGSATPCPMPLLLYTEPEGPTCLGHFELLLTSAAEPTTSDTDASTASTTPAQQAIATMCGGMQEGQAATPPRLSVNRLMRYGIEEDIAIQAVTRHVDFQVAADWALEHPFF
jgi:hypothetical protein